MLFFFDTYAIIEVIKGNKEYKKFAEEEILTSTLNLGELYYSLARDFDEETAAKWIERLGPSAITVSLETIVGAMKFRLRHRQKKLSFIDCYGYILAKEKNLRFLTGDKEFHGMENVEFTK